MAITPTVLSGSTNGRGVKIVATTATGTLIHTAATATAVGKFDEVYLWGVCLATVDKTLTIEFGGTTNPGDRISTTVPAKDGLHLLVPGLRLRGGVAVRAFCGAASTVIVHGYVNRSA